MAVVTRSKSDKHHIPVFWHFFSFYVQESLVQLIKSVIFTISSRIFFKNQLIINFVTHAMLHVLKSEQLEGIG